MLFTTILIWIDRFISPYYQSTVFVAAKFPHAFPHHQPVLDTQQIKDVYNSFETTSRQAFVDPRVRKEPVGCPEEEQEPICECPPEPQ